MSRDFPGSVGNYLQIGDVSAIDITGTAITVACWANLDALSAESDFVSKWDASGNARQYIIGGGNTANRVQFLVADGSTSTRVEDVSNISLNTWVHVCGVQTGSSVLLYRNGVQVNSSGVVKTLINETANLRIGARNDGSARTNGRIAEVGIWNASLTAGEVAALAGGIPPNLVRRGNLRGYWPLWGTGSPEPDYSSSGNPATITGSVPAAAHPPVVPSIILPFKPQLIAPGVSAFEDAATVYLDLQASGVEIGPYIDAATVPLDLQASGTELHIHQYVDSDTVYVNLQSSGVDIKETVDSATVYVNLQASGEDIYGPLIPWWDPLPTAENKWWAGEARKWRETATTRFTWSVRGLL